MSVGIADALTALHEAYISKVNHVIATGQEALAAELADDYADEALRLIGSAGPAQPASA